MLEILIEAILELFGIELPGQQKKKAPAPRPARQARPASGAEAKPSGGMTWEEMARKLAGLDAEEPAASPPRTREAAPPAPRPQPMARPVAAARSAPAMQPVAAATRRPATAPGRPAARAHAMAMKLRDNPAAAREAFVMAEIFGRPVGDRQQPFGAQ